MYLFIEASLIMIYSIFSIFAEKQVTLSLEIIFSVIYISYPNQHSFVDLILEKIHHLNGLGIIIQISNVSLLIMYPH